MGETAPQIAGFEVQRLLGRGGYGSVWLATQLSLGRPVALKVLPPDHLESRSQRRRFRQEAKLLAQLKHPHVMQVYAHAQELPAPYIALEYLPGGTLRQRLDDAMGRGLGGAAVQRLACELLDALATLHEARVVHRDVKPPNVLFREDGSAVLSDLGIAKMDSPAMTAVTGTGQLVGTLAYLPPEAFRGAAPSPAWDLFSLGVLLHEALGGRHPTEGRPFYLMVNERVPDVRLVAPDTPRELAVLIDVLLELDPAARPSSASDALSRMAPSYRRTRVAIPVLDDSDSSSSNRIQTRAQPSARSRAPLVAGLALAAALLAAALSVYANRPSAAAPPSPSLAASPSASAPVPAAARHPLASLGVGAAITHGIPRIKVKGMGEVALTDWVAAQGFGWFVSLVDGGGATGAPRALIATLARRGVRTLVVVRPDGPPDASTLARSLAELATLGPDSPVIMFQDHAMDTSQDDVSWNGVPEWCESWRDWLAHHAPALELAGPPATVVHSQAVGMHAAPGRELIGCTVFSSVIDAPNAWDTEVRQLYRLHGQRLTASRVRWVWAMRFETAIETIGRDNSGIVRAEDYAGARSLILSRRHFPAAATVFDLPTLANDATLELEEGAWRNASRTVHLLDGLEYSGPLAVPRGLTGITFRGEGRTVHALLSDALRAKGATVRFTPPRRGRLITLTRSGAPDERTLDPVPVDLPLDDAPKFFEEL